MGSATEIEQLTSTISLYTLMMSAHTVTFPGGRTALAHGSPSHAPSLNMTSQCCPPKPNLNCIPSVVTAENSGTHSLNTVLNANPVIGAATRTALPNVEPVEKIKVDVLLVKISAAGSLNSICA